MVHMQVTLVIGINQVLESYVKTHLTLTFTNYKIRICWQVLGIQQFLPGMFTGRPLGGGSPHCCDWIKKITCSVLTVVIKGVLTNSTVLTAKNSG